MTAATTVSLLWLAVPCAPAAPDDWEVGVLASGALGSGPAEEASWIGGQLGAQKPFGRLAVGGRLMGGATTPRAFSDPAGYLAVEPMARLWFSDPSRPAFSAVVGAGASFEDGVQAVLSAGTAVDLSERGGFRPRIEGGYHWQPGPQRWRLSLSVGVVWQRPEVEVPVAVEEPEPEPVEPVDGLVWIPEPVCDWVTYDEDAQRAGVSPLTTWDDEGLRPFGESRPESTSPEPSLVVAAWPGDVVLVEGVILDTDTYGLAVAHPPPGIVGVTVRGGGRLDEQTAAIPDEHALWLAIRPPEPIRVTFPVDVATLDAAARVVVARVADRRGQWVLEVRGSHSLEGDPVRNAELATLRAEATAEALREAGVPESRVVLSDALDVAGSDAPPELLRAAVIYPRLEEAP